MALIGTGCDVNIAIEDIFFGGNDPDKPDEFTCVCGCGEDPFGNVVELTTSTCAFDIGEAAINCSNACAEISCFFGSNATGPDLLGIDSKDCPVTEIPPPGFRTTGDVLNSSDGVLSYGISTASITYANETPIDIHVAGEFAFTGGCDSSPVPSIVATSCPITFNKISFVPDNFSLTTSIGTFHVTDALITNWGDQIGTQSGRSFVIPGANVQVALHGHVNGDQQALLFAPDPAQNLTGIHVPHTGEFGLAGHFSQIDGDLALTFNLNGTMIARPPVAAVAVPQTVSCNPLTGAGAVSLDGSASSDIDGDLQTVAWFDGDSLLGTGFNLGVELSTGIHTITGVAWDNTQKFNAADATVTVLHDAPPVFNAPTFVTVPACTPGLVILSTPEVVDLCSAASPTITGEIVEINGSVLVTPIPVDTVTGAVALPSGTAIIAWTATTDGGTATFEQTVEITGTADNSCCGAAQVLYEGTAAADSNIDPNATTGYCMFGYGANDRLQSGAFTDFISGGPGNDKLTSQGGDDVIFGDDGDDDITYRGNGTVVISGGAGDDKIHLAFGPTSQIFAGSGDDQVTCDGGNDTIYPGSGRDRIRAGSGDDTVIFYNVCEFDANKLLNGGAGDDTLILPVPLANLNGVTVVGFEHIIVDSSQSHLAECP